MGLNLSSKSDKEIFMDNLQLLAVNVETLNKQISSHSGGSSNSSDLDFKLDLIINNINSLNERLSEQNDKIFEHNTTIDNKLNHFYNVYNQDTHKIDSLIKKNDVVISLLKVLVKLMEELVDIDKEELKRGK